MVNFTYVDEPDLCFNTLLFQDQHPNNNAYFYNQVSNFSNTLTDYGRQFMEGSKEIYDKLNSSAAANMARAALRSAAGVFNKVIQPLYQIEDFQGASPLMQRWVMANPVVRELYHKQQCDGFADTYVDMHPGKIGENHYDYRRLMDGVVVDTDAGSFATYYLDDLIEGDRDLTHHEKCDILRTHDIMNFYIRAGNADPTSPLCGML